MRVAESSNCPKTPALKKILVRPIWYCSGFTPNLLSSCLQVSSTGSPLPAPAVLLVSAFLASTKKPFDGQMMVTHATAGLALDNLQHQPDRC